jgi:hypothetical protein
MRKPKESASEKERRLRHQPSARMSQDRNQGYYQKEAAPDPRSESDKSRNRGLNEDEQKKSANYVEDNAQSRASSPTSETNPPPTSQQRESGQVENTDDNRLEADDDKDDIN